MDKKERKNKQYERIMFIYILFHAFAHYKTAMLHSQTMKVDLSYEDSSNLSEMINEIFGMESYPTDFMPDKDVEANEAISEYNEYKKWRALIIDSDKRTALDAFCKYVINNGEFTILNGTGFMIFPTYIENVISYEIGDITFDELKNRFVSLTSLYIGKRKRTDSDIFRRDILRCERIYNQILNKQKERKG
jgi:hypothetical protein